MNRHGAPLCRISSSLLVFVAVASVARAELTTPEPAGQAPLPVARPATAEFDRIKPEPTEQGAVRRPFWNLLTREAEKHGLPPEIADAVTAIESRYDPSAIGAVGEIGLMQVRPSTAAMLGFAGDATELARPEVNIRYGVAYLAAAWRLANGDLCRALMKYRAGHGEEVMTPLSVQYCGRARAHLASVGSSWAEAPTMPLAIDPIVPNARIARRGIRTLSSSAAFWAAHEARVRAITARVHAKWRRVASR
jgi:hypothetical protein